MDVVMTVGKAKDSFLQIRIREDVKRDLGLLSESRGLSMSSLINSLIVRAIREEKAQAPETFRELAPIAAHISPSEETKTRRQIEAELQGGPLPAARIKVQREPRKKTGTDR